MRKFDSGAIRDSDTKKLDYEGFLSLPALIRYAEYLHEHRELADGTFRDSDNWQNGIPLDVYMKSMWRHFVDVWAIHRGFAMFDKQDGHEVTMQEALCAVLFNAFGYLHEILMDGRFRGLSGNFSESRKTDSQLPPKPYVIDVAQCSKCQAPDCYACKQDSLDHSDFPPVQGQE